MRDHTKLRAFELADELVLEVYQKTARFPKEEMFGLTSQLRRASVSVPSNIVEGSACASEPEYIRFLEISYGSAKEVEYQIGLSYRLGFLNEESHQRLLSLASESAKVLNGIISLPPSPDPPFDIETMEPEELPPGWEIRWPTPPEEHLPPPEKWWHQHDSEEWRNPELSLEDGKTLVLDAEPLPAEEFPVFSIG